MDDAHVVDVMQARGDLEDYVGQRVPVMSVKELRDLLPGEVLHREVGEAIVEEPEIEDLDDAGVLQRGKGGELGLELQKLLRLRQLMAEDLDGLVPLIGGVKDTVNA